MRSEARYGDTIGATSLLGWSREAARQVTQTLPLGGTRRRSPSTGANLSYYHTADRRNPTNSITRLSARDPVVAFGKKLALRKPHRYLAHSIYFYQTHSRLGANAVSRIAQF
jgi:hypothetical protein